MLVSMVLEVHIGVAFELTSQHFCLLWLSAVSGIVNRGCHDAPSCGTGVVDGGMERSANFQMALQVFGL